jgi:hypothetical protein
MEAASKYLPDGTACTSVRDDDSWVVLSMERCENQTHRCAGLWRILLASG